jgi:hypothetical protein
LKLLQAIDEATQGRTCITPLIAKGLVDAPMHVGEAMAKADQTSLRQREVLQLLAEELGAKSTGDWI